MAEVVPNPEHIRDFPDAPSFEAWLAAQHDTATELWLKIHKQQSGLPTVSYAGALEVALCWGWIDGQKKSFDDRSFLQRFTPRGPKSIWSERNVGHVERLLAEGRMTPHGLRHVEAAKADGRWQRAYAAGRDMEIPADLAAAIAANPAAQKTFETLNRQNLFALAFRTGNLKTPAGRARKIAGFVDMLARGETPHPNGKSAGETGVTAFAAFLRGVNLGRRSVKSADLVAAFEAMGLARVRTLIASGNVVFEGEGEEAPLQARIERGLADKFGFDVGTVLRTQEELRAMVQSDPFGGAVESDAQKLYVTLFAALEAEKLPLPCGLPGDFDVITVTAREIFHVAYRKPDGRYSADTQAPIWKPFGKKVLWTNRNWNTIIKAAAI